MASTLWERISHSLKGGSALQQQQREQHIRELERKFGASMPGSFRAFLLRGEDQEPYLNTCDVHAEEGGSGKKLYSFTIRKFLGLSPSAKDNYYTIYQKYQREMPLPGLIPIAFDQFRNIMALSLQDGRVYFWDKENMVQERDEFGNLETRHGDKLYYVATDFQDFEDRLYRFVRFT